MFGYFREEVSKKGNIFLQETHSSEDALKKWRNDFQGERFFSDGTANSCGGLTGFLGNRKMKCDKIRTDYNGSIIVLEAEIDDEIFLLINLYNPNTEAEQVKTLGELEQTKHVKQVKTSFHSNFGNNEHLKLGFLKYEIRKFTIDYSKTKAKRKREKVSFLGKKLKDLEQNLNNEETKL